MSRKALFSKPAWAAKAASPAEPDQPIFQQNVYEGFLEERRKREARKAHKEQEKREREKKSESRETKIDDDRTVKKQRLSNDADPIELDIETDEDDFDKEDSASDSDSDSRRTTKRNGNHKSTSPAGDTRQSSKTLQDAANGKDGDEGSASKQPGNASTATVIVDDDDDELVVLDVAPAKKSESTQPNPRSKPKPKPPPPPEPASESEEEDEYIRELKRKARAEAKEKNEQATKANAAATTTSCLDSPSSEQPSTSSSPPVQILIQTIIPNCPPIVVSRRPSQTLEAVQKHFCDTHQLRPNLCEKVFFTWNNQRLFKSTTSRSILDQIRRKHGYDKSEGKIVLEAVTDEIFQHRLRQKEESRRRAEGEDIEPAGDENIALSGDIVGAGVRAGADTTTEQEGAAAKSAGIVIKLTPEDPSVLTPLQLRVHSHTTIEKIVRGYKRKTGVEQSKNVYLVFEGEKLDEKSTVDEVGFEDQDTVDIRCR